MARALDAAQGLRLAFRLRWTSGPQGTVELIPTSPEGARWMERVLAASYGPGQWTTGNRPPGVLGPTKSLLGTLVPGTFLPARSPEGIASWADTALTALATLPAGGIVEWSIRGFPPREADRPAAPQIEPRRVPPGFRLAPLTDLERHLRERQAREGAAGWLVTVAVTVLAGRAGTLLPRLCGLISASSQGPGGANLRWSRPVRWLRESPRAFAARGDEVAALFPDRWTPVGSGRGLDPSVPGIPVGRAAGGLLERLPFPHAEGRHAVLLGETGMGKSSALTALALHAARRAGVVLLDPIGDTARAFLDRLPETVRGRALWVSPTESALPMNALAALQAYGANPMHREKARLDLVSALRRVRSFRYGETPFWGPRLEEMLGRALQAAAALPRGTLVDAEALLAGRASVPDRVPPGAEGLVRDLREAALQRPEEMDGARRLLAEVTGNAVLRRLLCEPDARLSPSDLLGPSSITVISGDAPATGESTARYLLAVYLALLWAELLSRPGGPKTVLALDEAQWYAHESVAEVLRLGRRSNIHLYLATQSLGSLPLPVREAILANAADFVLFRGSADDAREFSRWRPDLDGGDLLALDRGEAIVLLGKGRAAARVGMAGLPAAGSSGAARKAVQERGRVWHVVPTDGEGGCREPEESEHGPVGVPLLEVLRAALESAPGRETVELPLAAVRRILDPSGAGVRDLGRRLANAGAILERRRGESGTIWLLAARAVEPLLPTPPDPATIERARECWRQVAAEASTGGQPF